ncbi:anti-sigma-M factor RsmA [Mycobacterium cookii]|uniref:Anti-sigma-M factor RsmA n=1 Tax=Mycobacterium cookii TaxID=1775 RepID=A0A7I7KZB5_9MYCO|nr:hypothetical protein [Mycobacterium cookii]MCV7333357.1 hypothetical protein [Mycobacterium cookii]BBX47144.1 anti-sigma-M factor RsmA [Mycobacterium cookii]
MGDDRYDDSAPSVDALADLQAGLVDDDTAAQLRKRVRSDPDAQNTMRALNRVRRDVAALGSDPSSAPEVDPAAVDRIRATLGKQHAVHRGGLPRSARLAVAATGLAAVAVAIWLGTRALITAPESTPSRPTTIEHITVSRPPAAIPLSDQQILALLDIRPDFGALTDPHRRASCLTGLGYPADARPLGARPVDIGGRPAILLLLPGDTPGAVSALAVTPTCSSADTGLLADRIVLRP